MLDWEKENAQVILKFHYGRRGSINPIISKTMGKVAVISHAYQGVMPQPGTFWLCKIERELGEASSGGCFIVTPLRVVLLTNIVKLIPGTYATEFHGKTVVCRPRVDNHNWIIPFSLKKYFIKDKATIQYQSVVVPLRYATNTNEVHNV